MTLTSTIWPADPWGRTLNGAVSREQLPLSVLELAEDATDIAHRRFGTELHSVYLTGEVARNQGAEPEFIIVLRQVTRQVGLDLFSAAAGLKLQRQNPGFGICRFHVFCWEDIFPPDGRFSLARFRLAVNSIVFAGRDLKRLIAPQKLTIAAANPHIVGLNARLTSLVQRLKAISSESRVHATSRLFAQTALEAAFALVMVDEQVYTQDPETMASLAGLTFTDHRMSLAALVRMSRSGTWSSLEALSVADTAMGWLPGAAERWLDLHNPERIDAMPAV